MSTLIPVTHAHTLAHTHGHTQNNGGKKMADDNLLKTVEDRFAYEQMKLWLNKGIKARR